MSKAAVRRITLVSIFQAFIAATLFAVLYKYWLTAPVLRFVNIAYWRVLAILVVAGCGSALSLMGVETATLSCGLTVGLLVGGTLVAWTAPNDVTISLYAAFASHLESFWREMLILISAATLTAGFCKSMSLTASDDLRP